jgi:hypothetical protein
MSMKNPATPSEIEPAIFRFVAQCLNHCATASIMTVDAKHTVETLGIRNLARSPCSPVKRRVILVRFNFVYNCVLFYVSVDNSGYGGSNGRNVLN